MKISSILHHLETLSNQLDKDSRFVDLALQFQIVDIIDDKPVKTNEFSPIFGGVWDMWQGEYVDNRYPENVHVLLVARKVYDFLLDDSSREIMLKGGRRGMKSETGVLKALRLMIKYPGCPGGVTSYTFKASNRIWKKFLKKIPSSWFKPGLHGVKKEAKELHLLNGSWVHFGSADRPDSIRGEGDFWHFGDETRNWKKYAVENILFSLSEGGPNWQWFEATTPSKGEVYERWLRYQKAEDCKVYETNALFNPFIDHGFIRHLKKNVDPLFYAQEMGDFVSLQGRVYFNFDRAIHVRDYEKFKKYDTTYKWCSIRYHEAYQYIIGVDYNITPMCAIIFKMLDGGNIFAIDEIILDTDADSFKMGREIKNRGYQKGIIIDDASGEYSKGGRFGSRGFRTMGFRVIHPRKNPLVADRVSSVRAKFENVDGEASLFIDPKCKKLIEALESQEYDKLGVPEKGTFDHILDALGYVINRLFPIKVDYEKQEINLGIAA